VNPGRPKQRQSLDLTSGSTLWQKGSVVACFAATNSVESCIYLRDDQTAYRPVVLRNVKNTNFRFSPCIIIVNHFYYPTNAHNYTKLRV
jgi:hypothetical protein